MLLQFVVMFNYDPEMEEMYYKINWRKFRYPLEGFIMSKDEGVLDWFIFLRYDRFYGKIRFVDNE